MSRFGWAGLVACGLTLEVRQKFEVRSERYSRTLRLQRQSTTEFCPVKLGSLLAILDTPYGIVYLTFHEVKSEKCSSLDRSVHLYFAAFDGQGQVPYRADLRWGVEVKDSLASCDDRLRLCEP